MSNTIDKLTAAIEAVKVFPFTTPTIEALKEARNEVMHLESDLSYLKAILDGSWPSSVEQLTIALEKAKQIKKEKENER